MALQLRSEPRWPGVKPGRPHYESFYLKAARPGGGMAVWIRHTVWQAAGRPMRASLWLTLFDRRATGPVALKSGYPAERLRAGGETYIEIAGSVLRPGQAMGALTCQTGEASWELQFSGEEEAFRYLSRDWMYERPLPRTKALSLYPSASFSGRLEVAGRSVALESWPGMIGHNWGCEHPWRGCWLQGAGFAEDSAARLDAVVGRLKLGPVRTPWIGNGCLWLGGRRHRLGGSRPGATTLRERPDGAEFTFRGDGVTVEGTVHAPREQFVGWRYANPAGGWHPTLNCSAADMRLRVKRGSGPEQELTLSAGAAYELQLAEHDHGVALQPFPDP